MGLGPLVPMLSMVLVTSFSPPAPASLGSTDGEIKLMRVWASSVFAGAARWEDSRFVAGLPFSFVYGGMPSSKLLGAWRKSTSTRRLDSRRTLHVLSFEDPASGLVVTCDAVVYRDYASVDYLLRFANRGKSDSPVLESIQPLDLRLKVNKDERVDLHSSRGGGSTPEDYRKYREPLEEGRTLSLSAGGGRSSNTHMPWYNLQWPEGGMMVAIGWSGQWKATISRSENSIRLQAGMEDGSFRLRPGEQVRTPRIVLTRWAGDDLWRSYNINRHLMLDHYLPRVDGRLVLPPVSKPTSWELLQESPWRSHHGEENQLEIIREAAKLGIEAYWLDAYWFEGYFPKGVGNWQFPIANSVRSSFPRGLRPLADEAHRLGMKFILWFEPERVHPGTHVDKEKRDWLIALPNVEARLFNLGIPAARTWITRYITEVLSTFDVDVCRIDFNMNPLQHWRSADSAAGQQGLTEIRYIEGLYTMWDEIIRSKPGMWIDNCSSGGRRIDIETASRSIPLWRSDFNDNPKRKTEEIEALSNQVMSMGLSLYVPLASGGAWRWAPYYWRSGMAAGNIVGWDIRRNPATGRYDFDVEEARKGIREVQALRPYYLGDYYPLTEINGDPTAWAAYQYIRPREGDGFAVFFRRPESKQSSKAFQLRGVEPTSEYKVEWYPTYDLARTAVVRGRKLANFTADIDDAPGSLLVRFKRVDPGGHKASKAIIKRQMKTPRGVSNAGSSRNGSAVRLGLPRNSARLPDRALDSLIGICGMTKRGERDPWLVLPHSLCFDSLHLL